MAALHCVARKRSSVVVVAVVLLLTAGGCGLIGGSSGEEPSSPPAGTSEEPSAHDEVDPEQVTLEEARRHLAQYNVVAATELLAPLRSPEADTVRSEIAAVEATLRPWPDNATIPHIFFHSLIVDTALAFDGDEDSAGYDLYMATQAEFERTLESLYERGYILVSPHDIAAKDDAGRMQYRPIMLPEGKHPIVLSQDDANYYDYMSGDGFATRLVLRDGRVVNEYIDAEGAVHEGDYDIVPIVDRFVEQHPDFAYHGHKGVLAVTGYEGVLGYRTSPFDPPSPTFAEDQEQAKEVAAALRDTGWEFASHSWGHIDLGTADFARFQRDAQRWRDEVEPLVGPTDLLIYPFGADIAGPEPYGGPKYDLFRELGFSYFFGVDGSTNAWHQLGGDYLRQARINIDGIRLRGAIESGGGVLAPFFDPQSVIDTARPVG
ncbi:polysaccharide deacetylase [Aeromicrobium phragmitis]|uniref:Polysaccharide deacetylase n=1 Tax=Aeromicrobium phragmitis TaxID=2478914 RepID=A0A3L8PJ50_9ACTN|nr:polysaccharide deacetylase family protein [Aeromicrobium phragmitis]RLV55377.1 polysaccharide deacetylase [Aeromicrobium phragmitis]